VAVGEIGLDFAIPDADRRRQIDVFTEQLDLARRLDLPVILHCRRAFDAMEALLRERGPVRGVLHAFSRGPELARRLVDGLDLHLAFGGAVTRPGARRPRESAAAVPASRLLLETDAPSIGLEGVPPEQTEPRHVAQVAEAVAELRGESLEQVAEQTTENARRLFKLP
jgi:TatD DNase family protein